MDKKCAAQGKTKFLFIIICPIRSNFFGYCYPLLLMTELRELYLAVCLDYQLGEHNVYIQKCLYFSREGLT